MRRINCFLAVAAGSVLAAHGAAAQGAWYISGSAGGLFMSDRSGGVTITNPGLGLSAPGTNTSTYSPGETANLALGYQLPAGFRVEGELGYQHFQISTVSPLVTNGVFPQLNGSRLSDPSGGDHNVFTATANLFYDLPFTFAGITPYIGGGAGYYYSTSTNAVFLESTGGRHFTQRGGTADNAILLGEIGASYHLTSNLSLVSSYRYEYLFSQSSAGGFGGNIVKLGLRYSFGAAPAPVPVATPAAAPAPAVAPARSYLVFFDWDKATLTDRARQIINEASAASARVQYTRIDVNGYTDSSGTPQYNQGLSLRRAQAVAAELIKDGVPQAAITIQGFGETHPLVQTGPGVREPQNRRVEIIIR